MTENMMNNEMNLEELEQVAGGSFWRKVAVIAGAVPVGIGCGLLSLTGVGAGAVPYVVGGYATLGTAWAISDERR